MDLFTIRKNSERYEGVDRLLPEEFTISGLSLAQAREVARRLSNYNAGCDYSWYVDGDPEMECHAS